MRSRILYRIFQNNTDSVRVLDSGEKTMRFLKAVLLVMVMFPVAAWAQYKDLDAAVSSLQRGFERGETQPVIEGISAGDQVMLQFPGLVSGSGPFGRDQASYLLDELFNKTHPSGFQVVSARKVSAEGQYHINAKWGVNVGAKTEDRDLYITLRNKDDRWAIVSIRSASK